MNPKISVVIPVYNTIGFLDRSIGAALGQSLRDIEVICIDDGSTDGSLERLKSLSKTDKRLRVISFGRHLGVCDARNAGIDAADGKWIYFMDSDDWIGSDFLQRMLDKAEDVQCNILTTSSFIKENENGTHSQECTSFPFMDKSEGFYSSSAVQSGATTALWLRLYRRDFIRRNALRFPSALQGAEDIYFTSLGEALSNGRSFVFQGPVYHYFQREGSLFHRKEFYWKCIENCIALYEEYKARGIEYKDFKLFWAHTQLSVDSEHKYHILREFFSDIKDSVTTHTHLYNEVELFLFEKVTSAADVQEFRRSFGTNLGAAMLRNRLKSES